MKQFKTVLILLALPCLALQCNNDNPNPDNSNGNKKEQFPTATQSVENTFGCKVNGEVWVPEAPQFQFKNFWKVCNQRVLKPLLLITISGLSEWKQ